MRASLVRYTSSAFSFPPLGQLLPTGRRDFVEQFVIRLPADPVADRVEVESQRRPTCGTLRLCVS